MDRVFYRINLSVVYLNMSEIWEMIVLLFLMKLENAVDNVLKAQ